jgi:hypothetical protein
MTDEAPEPPARAIIEQAMNALEDVLGQLEPVTGPAEVTRVHHPPQDHCDDFTCPCGLPPQGAVPVTVMHPGEPRPSVAGWTDGHTTALICWRGWDGPARPADPSRIQTWTRTATDERGVVMTLASLGQYDNVELVGAWLLTGRSEKGAG